MLSSYLDISLILQVGCIACLLNLRHSKLSIFFLTFSFKLLLERNTKVMSPMLTPQMLALLFKGVDSLSAPYNFFQVLA